MPPSSRLPPPLPLARLCAVPMYRPLDRRRGAGRALPSAPAALLALPAPAPSPRPRSCAELFQNRTKFNMKYIFIIKGISSENSVLNPGGAVGSARRGAEGESEPRANTARARRWPPPPHRPLQRRNRPLARRRFGERRRNAKSRGAHTSASPRTGATLALTTFGHAQPAPGSSYSVRDRGCAEFSLLDETGMIFLPGAAARRGVQPSPNLPCPDRIPETTP